MFLTKAGVENVKEHNRTQLLLYEIGQQLASASNVTVTPKCGEHQ